MTQTVPPNTSYTPFTNHVINSLKTDSILVVFVHFRWFYPHPARGYVGLMQIRCWKKKTRNMFLRGWPRNQVMILFIISSVFNKTPAIDHQQRNLIMGGKEKNPQSICSRISQNGSAKLAFNLGNVHLIFHASLQLPQIAQKKNLEFPWKLFRHS